MDDNSDNEPAEKNKEESGTETEKKTTTIIKDETDKGDAGVSGDVSAKSSSSSSEEGGSMVTVVGGPVCETKDESGRHVRLTPGFEEGYCDVCCEKKAVRLVLEFVNGKLKRKAGVCGECVDSIQKSTEDIINEYGKEESGIAAADEKVEAEKNKDPSSTG